MTYDLEVQYLRFILDRMRSEGEGNRLLVNTERVYLAKTNLILLKACLEQFGERGLFIAIDRPYHYMSHLLRIHRIPHDRLKFIDAITNISGESRVEADSVSFLDSPFTIHKLFRDLKYSRTTVDGDVEEFNLLESDFVIVDDVSTIFYYGAVDSGKQVIRDYLSAFESHDDTFTAVAVDREVHRELYEFLSQFCDGGVDMGTAAFQIPEDETAGRPGGPMERAKPTEVRG